MRGDKMRKILLLWVGCFLLLAVAHLGFGQDVASNPAKSAFLQDLSLARKGDREAKLGVARTYNEGTVVWRNAPEAAWWFRRLPTKGRLRRLPGLAAYIF